MKCDTHRYIRPIALLSRSVRWVRSDLETSRRLLMIVVTTSLFLLCLIFKPGGPKITDEVSSLVDIALGLLGAWWCFAAALSQSPNGGRRLGLARRVTLSMLGLGVLAAVLGDLVWSYNETLLHRTMPFPSWADACYLSQYPLLLLGILRLPTRRLPPALRWRVVLDSLITLTALVTLSWYFVLGPTVLHGTGSGLSKLLAAAFPVGDLVLLFSLLLVMAQERGSVPRPAVVALSIGLMSIIFADTDFLYRMLKGTYTSGSLAGVCGPLAYLTVGLGARLSCRGAGWGGRRAPGRAAALAAAAALCARARRRCPPGLHLDVPRR